MPIENQTITMPGRGDGPAPMTEQSESDGTEVDFLITPSAPGWISVLVGKDPGTAASIGMRYPSGAVAPKSDDTAAAAAGSVDATVMVPRGGAIKVTIGSAGAKTVNAHAWRD